MPFSPKPITISAQQWFKLGDHTQVDGFHDSSADCKSSCKLCGKKLEEHGQIKSSYYPLLVCPCDWIIRSLDGKYYPCKPGVFKNTYQEVKLFDKSFISLERTRKERLARIVYSSTIFIENEDCPSDMNCNDFWAKFNFTKHQLDIIFSGHAKTNTTIDTLIDILAKIFT